MWPVVCKYVWEERGGGTDKINYYYQLAIWKTACGKLVGWYNIMLPLLFKDATSVLSVEESATEGWKEDPVEFNAYNSLDCDIQIWAYRFVWLEKSINQYS